MKKPCKVPTPHHSKDRVEVYHGAEQPTLMCGYHAQDVNQSLRKIREAQAKQ